MMDPSEKVHRGLVTEGPSCLFQQKTCMSWLIAKQHECFSGHSGNLYFTGNHQDNFPVSYFVQNLNTEFQNISLVYKAWLTHFATYKTHHL